MRPGQRRLPALRDGARALRGGARAPRPPRGVHARRRARGRAGARLRARGGGGGDAASTAERIRTLARDFAAAPRGPRATAASAPAPRSSAALASWLVDVLNVLTGNLDRPGGALFPRPAHAPAEDWARRRGRVPYARWRSHVRGLPEFAGELPVAGLAEEIDSAGDARLRALVTVAGNPVLSTPNGARLAQGPREPRLHRVGRPLPERDHAPRPRDPADDAAPRARPTTTSSSTPSRCATTPSGRRRRSRGPRRRATCGGCCSELAGRSTARTRRPSTS